MSTPSTKRSTTPSTSVSYTHLLVIGIGTRDVDAVTDIILEMSAAPADVEVIKLRGDIGVWLRSHFLGDIDKLDVGAVLAN